jgi:uncharacterized phage protein (TIGR01671 family)
MINDKMREIKFRAWDTEVKTMYSDLKYLPPFKCNENEEIWVMMQFTGLKDKVGKEIYEGDIIRTYEYNDSWDDGAIGDVTWDNERAQFRFNWKILLVKSGEKDFRDPISTICSSSAYNSDRSEGEIEVIGNIYENPEILENKK